MWNVISSTSKSKFGTNVSNSFETLLPFNVKLSRQNMFPFIFIYRLRLRLSLLPEPRVQQRGKVKIVVGISWIISNFSLLNHRCVPKWAINPWFLPTIWFLHQWLHLIFDWAKAFRTNFSLWICSWAYNLTNNLS